MLPDEVEKVAVVLNDNRPFPVQGELGGSRWGRREACAIPWWLAQEAYEVYSGLHGQSQTLGRLAERGGFGRDELILLLRRGDVQVKEESSTPEGREP